jgi:hypothetical protein
VEAESAGAAAGDKYDRRVRGHTVRREPGVLSSGHTYKSDKRGSCCSRTNVACTS